MYRSFTKLTIVASFICLSGCGLHGTLPVVEQHLPTLSHVQQTKVVESKTSFSNSQASSAPKEKTIEDNSLSSNVSTLPSFAESKERVINLAQEVIPSYYNRDFKDSEYAGYSDLHFYTEGMQDNLIRLAEKQRKVTGGRSITRQVTNIHPDLNSIKTEENRIVMTLSADIKGSEMSEAFHKKNITINMSFKWQNNNWLVSDLSFSEFN